MVFIIDDKDVRQKNYGWDKERFSKYEKNGVQLIATAEELFSVSDMLSDPENIIMYHTSFWNDKTDEYTNHVKEFYLSLNSKDVKAKVVFFSGSNPSRWHNDNWTRCIMQPYIFYDHLEVFLDHLKDGDTNFEYLLLGEAFQIEESLRLNQTEINRSQNKYSTINNNEHVFFAVAKNNSTSPFAFSEGNKNIKRGWDIFKDGIVTDNKLDELVKEWFSINVYDSIYIPLCFGSVWSDYMGLRLAMHIRFTDTPNRYKPIFVYGEADYRDLCGNECFSILNCKGIQFISSRRNVIIDSLGKGEIVTPEQFQRELNEIIHINIPSNIGTDNHSVSNKWAIYRWYKMIEWGDNVPNIPQDDFLSSMYFKYLCAKYGEHDEYRPRHKYSNKISGIENRTILYIDDEYGKGWYSILSIIIENSGAKLIPYTDFQHEKQELICKIKEFIKKSIQEKNPECFILDLRLCNEDFVEGASLTGHEIATYIKEDKEVGNKGHQIVILSASDKIWNLKNELFEIGAIGYALKESPISNYSRNDSKELYKEFANSIQNAIKLSYLKGLYAKQKELTDKNHNVSQLDGFIELLQKDKANGDPNMLQAALLIQCCFLEDYIINLKGFEVVSIGEDPQMETFLRNKKLGIDYNLIGHLFLKRQQGYDNKKTNIIDFSFFKDFQEDAPDGMGNPKSSDAVIIIGALLQYYDFEYEQVKLYVDVKYIRNSTIAHGSGQAKVRNGEIPPQKITPQLIQDFYYKVIVPVVEKEEK